VTESSIETKITDTPARTVSIALDHETVVAGKIARRSQGGGDWIRVSSLEAHTGKK
jgi:hypothetical protein